MTDCGHFTGAEDWDDEAVFSAGWQYTNINPETITSIKVTAKDAKERIVVEYTADEKQVAWQKKNNYITAQGLSSVPFYKEYKGAPLKEQDSDWNAKKGEGFDIWQPTHFYLEVVADGDIYKADIAYAYDYPHIHEAIKVEAVAPTIDKEGNIEYWYCPDCGKYFADKELTKELTYEDTLIAKLSKENAAEKNDDTPKTGDTGSMMALAIMALIATSGIAGVTVISRRRKA